MIHLQASASEPRGVLLVLIYVSRNCCIRFSPNFDSFVFSGGHLPSSILSCWVCLLCTGYRHCGRLAFLKADKTAGKREKKRYYQAESPNYGNKCLKLVRQMRNVRFLKIAVGSIDGCIQHNQTSVDIWQIDDRVIRTLCIIQRLRISIARETLPPGKDVVWPRTFIAGPGICPPISSSSIVINC